MPVTTSAELVGRTGVVEGKGDPLRELGAIPGGGIIVPPNLGLSP